MMLHTLRPADGRQWETEKITIPYHADIFPYWKMPMSVLNEILDIVVGTLLMNTSWIQGNLCIFPVMLTEWRFRLTQRDEEAWALFDRHKKVWRAAENIQTLVQLTF